MYKQVAFSFRHIPVGLESAQTPSRGQKEKSTGGWNQMNSTLSAFKRACSSSSAACFSLSSTFVKEMPVFASDDTAFERVLALEMDRKRGRGEKRSVKHIKWGTVRSAPLAV